MKSLLFILFVLFISVGSFARDPGDSPTPFPLGQAPEDLVGQWNSREEIVVIEHAENKKGTRETLYVAIYRGSYLISQGYLYFEGDKFCGVMDRTRGADYNLCVWKENKQLRTATFTDGEKGAVRRYR